MPCLIRAGYSTFAAVGADCRALLLQLELPEAVRQAIREGFQRMVSEYGSEISFAVRSSATAEDLPTASFAGQQETYLDVQGEDLHDPSLCHQCFASLYTDRAIKYRIDNGFEHAKVALSVGVQRMVRSDLGCSGVMFTLDPDSGFENVVLISGSYGLGENIVQGNVNSDEWLVFKELAGDVNRPIISRKLGSKELTMVYTPVESWDLRRPESAIQNIETSLEMRQKFVLQDNEIRDLALWGKAIEAHYGCHMDIEWAKDGITNEFFIVQARPETVHSQKGKTRLYTEYELKTKGKVLCKGVGLGNRITSGKARILQSPSEIDLLQADEILVTCRTDPDWDPVLMKAAAIVTDQGGRTSHAAIVAREMGAVAVVGTGNATSSIQNGQLITVNAAEGDSGSVLEGQLEWTEKTTDISNVKLPRTQPMLILGHPSKAFQFAQLPNAGVGLMRMEFIINNAIGIHPMALHHFDKLEDQAVKSEIEAKTHAFPDKKRVLSAEWQGNGGDRRGILPQGCDRAHERFQQATNTPTLWAASSSCRRRENPMIGFVWASRCYHPLYREDLRWNPRR